MKIAKVMGLAHQVSKIKSEEITAIINDGIEDQTQALGNYFNDDITPKIRAVCAIMAFAAAEIRKTMPDLDYLEQQTELRKHLLSPEQQVELNTIVKEQLGKIKDEYERNSTGPFSGSDN